MNSIFSEERVNTGRQLEFDLVKAVTIVLMIWTHTYEALSTGFEPSLSAINSYVRGSIALKERTEAFFGRHRVFWTVFVWTICIASFILAMCLFDEYPNFMNDYNI